MSVKNISATEISKRVAEMCVKANSNLPQDVLKRIEECLAEEQSPCGQEILRQIISNAKLAPAAGLPLCQDTGMAVFFVELGADVRIDGGSLYDAINAGVRQGYAGLRKSMCDPFSRANTTDNTPAMVHVELTAGSNLKILYLAKGGGSENMSRVTMLAPAQGWSGIKEFVLQRLAEAKANPCPPVIIGIGIGSSFENVGILAKKALLLPLDAPNPLPELQEKEAELLSLINRLGIGPMGLGGNTTCLGVRIATAPCHIASLPLGVNIQCHSARHAEVIL